MMARREHVDEKVQLPPGLTTAAIRKTIGYVEKECSELIEIYLEQANVFSALVSIFGAKGLDTFSVYEKSRHTYTAQQRFPDLRKKGSGENPPPNESLESKGSKRPWALQSHYDHPGWYIIWRYGVDPTLSIDPGKPFFIWRVEVIRLQKSDWKYEKSGAGHKGGGRTETFGLKYPADKLRDKAVYQRLDIKIQGGKIVPIESD